MRGDLFRAMLVFAVCGTSMPTSGALPVAVPRTRKLFCPDCDGELIGTPSQQEQFCGTCKVAVASPVLR